MAAVMFSREEAKELADHYGALAAKVPLHSIKNEEQYDVAVNVLNALMDAGGADEHHALGELVAALGEYIGEYEDAHHQWEELPPNVVLRELMALHGINQSQLPEVGSQGVVSEVLNGKRELNVRQIDEISRRFHVSPAIFFSKAV